MMAYLKAAYRVLYLPKYLGTVYAYVASLS